ncbi:MAG: ribonuclease J [Candidatus Paracaedibacteraceae bacterium]|nr:ribonuclease J [Candidatus Paracaedibacteraceae bacterium]
MLTDHMNELTPEEGLVFVPLGGAGEIGMNLNLYGYNDQWIMIDLGVTFQDQCGVQVVAPDPKFIEENKDNLHALILTHAHEDHVGAIPYLWSRLRCPIYATPFTMEIVKNKLTEAGIIGQVELHTIPLGGQIELGDFKIQYVHLTHSIPEPNGLLIETPLGRIFHTGDWKIDPHPVIGNEMDVPALKKIGDEGVLAMVCDSTNVFELGNAGSEQNVREALIDLVKKQKNRVVITCFASNIARLDSCIEAAKQSGRFVVFVGRSMDTMINAATDTNYFSHIPHRISIEKAADLPRDQVLYVCTGSQGEAKAALKRIARNSYPNIRLDKGDVVIFSSRRIPGNEERISEVKNDLVRSGVTILDHKESLIHVSGHPFRDDLQKMYEWIRPKIAVPIHGEYQHLMEHGRFAKEECGVKKVIIPENGSFVILGPDEPQIVERVHHGYLGNDGHDMIDMYGSIIRDRQKLSINGVVFASLHWDQDKHKILDVQVSSRGVIEIGIESQNFEQNMAEKIFEFVKNNKKLASHHLEEEVRLLIRRQINRLRGIKPLVIIHNHD